MSGVAEANLHSTNSPLNNKVAENGAAAGGNLSQVPPLEKGKSSFHVVITGRT